MIPQRDLSWQTQSWQEQLSNAVNSSTELLAKLNLSAEEPNLSEKAAKQFPVLAPHAFIDRINPEDPNDPLLRQILNVHEEDIAALGFSSDPLEESSSNPVKGLVRKYKNRALLIVTGKCAINCRYCFRREFPYNENNPSRKEWGEALSYISNHDEIEEVILSGGDPLSVSDKHLHWLIEAVSAISSIKRLRIHTRMPIVIPDRITDDLLRILEECKLTTIVVLHVNHSNEIDEQVKNCMIRLKAKTDFLLNQSVLLKGVNDSLDAQLALHNTCVDAGIQPYYLHFLDRVNGTSHFEVPKEKALALYTQMQHAMSGYMLPKLVIELPNAQSKQILK